MNRRSPRSRPLHRARYLAAALAAAGLALAGCGGSDSADSPASAGGAQSAYDKAVPPAAEVGGRAAVDSDGGGGSEGSPAGGPSGPDATAPQQRIIRTGEMTVEVKDLRTAAARVRSAAESLGGFVSSEVTGFSAPATARPDTPGAWRDTGENESELRHAGSGESVLTLRIPEGRYTVAVDRVAQVGTELSRTSSSENVTAEVADLSSRVKTQEASVARVRALLERATSLKDIVLLESELTRRQADLDALKARLAALAGQADLSTLTVVLRTPAAEIAEEDDEGFLAGLEAGWDAVKASTLVVLTVLGALLPVAIVLGLLALPFVLLHRSRRGRTGGAPRALWGPPAPVTSPGTPAPAAAPDAARSGEAPPPAGR